MTVRQDTQTAHPAPASSGRPAEDRRAEAITVLWMLAAVATLAAEAVSLGSRALLWLAGAAGVIGPIVPAWFALCALVTGTVCLLLTPVVWAVRRQKPPYSVVVTAVAISLLPWIVLAAERIFAAPG